MRISVWMKSGFFQTGILPHKGTGGSDSWSVMERVEMVRQAIQGVPYFKVSEYEAIENATFLYLSYHADISAKPIRSISSILFWERIPCLQLNSGNISREIFPTCTILGSDAR